MTFDLTQAHPRQRSNALRWLKNLRAEIDAEIRSLEAATADDRDSQTRRAAFNALMRDLISNNCTDAEAEKTLLQRGYPPQTIVQARKLLKRAAAHRRRTMRDAEIMRRVLVSNEKPSALAKEYKLSRKRIYEILDKADPMDKKKDAVFTPRPVLGGHKKI